MSVFRLFWKRVRVFGPLVLVLCSFILMHLGMTAASLPGGIKNQTEIGQPIIAEDRPILRDSAIEKVLNDDEYIYVMFGSNGLVELYTLDGEYVRSIYFYSHRNGAFEMGLFRGDLVVKDKVGNLYFFDDGAFEEFCDRKSVRADWKAIDYEMESSEYILRSGSVWHTDAGGEEIRVIKETALPTYILEHSLFYVGVCLNCLSLILLRRNKKGASASETAAN